MIHHYINESEIINLNRLHVPDMCQSCNSYIWHVYNSTSIPIRVGKCKKYNRITNPDHIGC